MPSTSSAPPIRSLHRLPEQDKIDAVLDHTDTRVPAERVIDSTPIFVAVAASTAQCVPCQDEVAGWLAQHGDPWTVIRLAGPVAADARRILRLAPAWLSAHTRVSDLLASLFSEDVARIVGIVASAHDLAPAAQLVQSLVPLRRHAVIRSVLNALTQGPALLSLLTTRRARRGPIIPSQKSNPPG